VRTALGSDDQEPEYWCSPRVKGVEAGPIDWFSGPPENEELAMGRRLDHHAGMAIQDMGILRSEMLAQRQALSPGVVTRHSTTVVQRIRSLPEVAGLTDGAVVGAYLGVRGEIDPSSLMTDPSLRVALPVTTPGQPLRFVVPNGTLVDGPFGIRQPDRGDEVDPMDLALVLVPLVAADRRGNRVGHGAGFYDRTFAATDRTQEARDRKVQPVLIGLCHHLQLVEELDPHPWDVPLDLLVTEVGLIRP